MPKDMHYICRNTDFEYPWYEEDKELLKSSKVLPFLALNEVALLHNSTFL